MLVKMTKFKVFSSLNVIRLIYEIIYLFPGDSLYFMTIKKSAIAFLEKEATEINLREEAGGYLSF
jgi:hypothetical protein